MTTHRFKTNLRCQGCVQSIAPILAEEPGIRSWHADVSGPDKVLTVETDVPRSRVEELLNRAGYRILEELPAPEPVPMNAPLPPSEPSKPPRSALTTYYPLLLILAYLLGVVAIVEWNAGVFEPMRAMSVFMAGFFLVFSFFKLLNLPGFAMTYAGYDVLAARWYAWGYLYPFAELALGIAYSLRLAPAAMVGVNLATLALMVLGLVGVIRSLFTGRKIQCACLGTFFDLPMSTVTLVEDLLMALMALAMLLM